MGKVLPKPLHLQQKEQKGTSTSLAPLTPSSTLFVLWLPNSDPRSAGSNKQKRSQDHDKEDSHMQPANNRVLALGWQWLQELRQASVRHALGAGTFCMNVRSLHRVQRSTGIAGELTHL